MNIEKAKKKLFHKRMILWQHALIHIGEILEKNPELMLEPSMKEFRYLELLFMMSACGCEDINFKILAELDLLSHNDWKYFKAMITKEMPDIKSWKQLKKMYRY